MGNHLERISHLQYSELPTGDPSCGGLDADETQQLRVGVAYFFSDDEEEADDRTTSPTSDCGLAEEEEENGLQVALVQEVQYSAFCSQECIFSKLQDNREELAVYSDKTLLSMCKPGDLLELVANHSAPHWAVYTESDQVIHLHKGEIRRDSLLAISNGRRGRIVNERYRYRPLPAALVTQNAAGHLGLSAHDIQWSDSESFAAWCRFGKREFKAGGEGPPAGVTTTTNTATVTLRRHPEATERRYFLKVHLGGVSHTLLFHRLEDMIRERRRVDASGILQELQLVHMKE